MDVESRPLRVLMTADTVGGVWQFAVELAAALRAQGDRVLIAAMSREPTQDQRRAAARAGAELESRACKLVWMQDPWADIDAAGAWLQELADDFAPDVVHLNDFGHGDLAWPAPVLMTGHSCVCSWWQAVHGGEAPPEWNRYRQQVRAGLLAADEVVAPTHAMLHALQRHYGPLSSARVIPNGRTLPQRLPVPKEPIVFAAGRLWDAAKNLAALTAVAPRLPWPVHVAGDTIGPQDQSVPLANVHALGHLVEPELHARMARAAIYALPARYEPFGLSILEAAQQGCALVLGDIPSLREVWGDSACFVPPDDHGALEATLRRLIDDVPFRIEMAASAKHRATRYRPEMTGAGYRDRFLALAARRDSIPFRRVATPRPVVAKAVS